MAKMCEKTGLPGRGSAYKEVSFSSEYLVRPSDMVSQARKKVGISV